MKSQIICFAWSDGMKIRIVFLQPAPIQTRGKLWCLNWRSWVTWDTTRTLSIYWEPAPTEVRQHPVFVPYYVQWNWNIVKPCLKVFSHPVQGIFNITMPFACKHAFFVERVTTWCVSPSGPVLVITEYCSLGDLLNFLRQKAETFVNFVMNIPDIMENSNDYKNICNQKQFIRRYITKHVQSNETFNLCYLFLPTSHSVVLLHPTVTVGSPAHPQAVTWRWDPASRQMWNHLKVKTKSFFTQSQCFLTLGVTNIISVWFLPRLCVRGDWWLAAWHWWFAEVFLSSGSGPWLSGGQKREWFHHWEDLNVQTARTENNAVIIYSSSCCDVPRKRVLPRQKMKLPLDLRKRQLNLHEYHFL